MCEGGAAAAAAAAIPPRQTPHAKNKVFEIRRLGGREEERDKGRTSLSLSLSLSMTVKTHFNIFFSIFPH